MGNFLRSECHCAVPVSHKEDNILLGRWLAHQREDKLNEKLSPDRFKRLYNLGVSWDPIGDLWEKGFVLLVKFKERTGHCNVAQSHKKDGFKLGFWLKRQRETKDKLDPVQRRRLLERDVEF